MNLAKLHTGTMSLAVKWRVFVLRFGKVPRRGWNHARERF